MPTYYNQVLGLDLKSSGLFSVLPWVTMAISANIGGWIADTMVERGVTVTTVRKIMQTVGPACACCAGGSLALYCQELTGSSSVSVMHCLWPAHVHTSPVRSWRPRHLTQRNCPVC